MPRRRKCHRARSECRENLLRSQDPNPGRATEPLDDGLTLLLLRAQLLPQHTLLLLHQIQARQGLPQQTPAHLIQIPLQRIRELLGRGAHPRVGQRGHLCSRLPALGQRLQDPLASQMNPIHERIFAHFPVSYYWSTYQSEWAMDPVVLAPILSSKQMCKPFCH
jgi:hypothetical protein